MTRRTPLAPHAPHAPLARLGTALAFLPAFGLGSAGALAADRITTNFEMPITNIPGKSLVAVEVEYLPGGTTPAHVHAKSAFIYAYVVSGAIESQVNDGPVQVFKAGQSWHETPGSRHTVSRNASKTEPAKLLAVFVVDSGDKELTTITGK